MRGSVLAILAIAIAGCSMAEAPEIESAADMHYGSEVAVEWTDRSGHHYATGELLAIDDQRLAVGTRRGTLLLPLGLVSAATVFAYDAEDGKFGTWTALGTVSTLSHGIWLIFTAPIWLISGISISAAESWAGVFDIEDPVEKLRVWARFPQGLPPAYLAPRTGRAPAPLPQSAPTPRPEPEPERIPPPPEAPPAPAILDAPPPPTLPE